MTISYRSHRAGDAAALSRLTTVAMPQDGVSCQWFTENVILDINFDPHGLLVAEDAGTPVGFVYAVAACLNPTSDPTVGGWLTIGAVHPSYQGRGIAATLLQRAVDYLSGQGAAWMNVSAYPPAYFVPGLDEHAYPEATRLLARQGFSRLYTASAMALELSTYSTPADVRTLTRQRIVEGYQIGAAGPDDLPEVLDLARQEFASDWADAIRDAVLRYGYVGRVRIVRAGQRVVGFAIYGAYRGLPERFGPFGVDSSLRGTGLGKILLHDTLTAMRAEGAHSAWFLWTDEESPAGHLYRRAGFEVTRRFEVLRRDLDRVPRES